MHSYPFKTLVIDIRDKFNQIHTLQYRLFDTPLSNKYSEVLRRNKAIADGNIDSSFNSNVEADYPEICEEIKNTVRCESSDWGREVLPQLSGFQPG